MVSLAGKFVQRWLMGESYSHIGTVIVAGLVAVLVMDIVTPLGFAHGTLYVPLVLLALLTRSARLVGFTAIAACVLILLGYFISAPPPPGVSDAIILLNRAGSLLAILLVWLLVAFLLVIDRDLLVSRASEQRNLHLLEIASDTALIGGWTVWPDEGRLEWTKEVFHIYGLPPGEPPSLDTAIEYYAPEYRDRIQALVDACATNGEPFDEELQIVTHAGIRKWVRAVGRPIRDASGKITGLEGAFQDIQAQKDAAASLAASRQRFREFADAMPIVIWSADAAGNIDYFNRHLVDFTGMQYEVLSEPGRWLTVLHPEDQEPCVDEWQRCVATGKAYRIEFRIVTAEGDYRWHLIQAQPVCDPDGRVERWIGSAIDIDDQKRLARQFQQTLESITDGFFAIDSRLRFTYVNPKMEEFTGKTRNEMLGRYLFDVFPEAESLGYRERYEEVLRTGQPMQLEEYYPPLDGWYDINIYPSEGGLSVYVRDRTNQRKLEQQLHQSQRLESIGQLTGGVAHDFNNLLTVIMGNAEHLLETTPRDHDTWPLLEMIQSAAARGSDLTHRLLAFARKQPLEPELVDINQLTRDLDSLLRRTLGEYIEIEFVRAAGLWPVTIDVGQMESALLNLCINARDAMPAGGRLSIETANVHIDQEYADQHADVLPGQYVMIAVSDTGEGIGPDLLPRIFEPFFTTKTTGGGTGLGLPMVYGFIKQSGGHVNIYSETGQGTVVKLYLPRALQGSVLRHAGRTMRNEVPRGDERILVVEDDEMVRSMAVRQLQSLGYQVLEAASGPQALEVLDTEGPVDLLFTDIVMAGGMSGKQLADAAQARQPGLRVLYTSGYTGNAIVHHGRVDPGVQLLGKPYRRTELARRVRSMLDGPPPATP